MKDIPNDRLDFNVIKIIYDNYVNKSISTQERNHDVHTLEMNGTSMDNWCKSCNNPPLSQC